MSRSRSLILFGALALFFACGRTSPVGSTANSGSAPGEDAGSSSGSASSSSSGASSSGSGSSSGGSGSSSSGGSGSSSGTEIKCPPTNGCCGLDGGTAGTSDTACGFAGQPCVDCSAIGLRCVPAMSGVNGGGVCGSLDAGTEPDGATQCGPANCAGCCAANACLPGTSASNCGSHGLACAQCTVGSVTCARAGTGGGTCIGSEGNDGGGGAGCSPDNCAGCCDQNGECQDSLLIGACGTMGFACQFCLPGEACNSGQCQTVPGCGPANCFGCCHGNTCVPGTDPSACGTGGAACQMCSGTTCFVLGGKSGGQCSSAEVCGISKCGSGCCDAYYQCQSGHSNTYCDTGGGGPPDVVLCGTCSGDCSSGSCVGTSCGASNCSDGCCMPDGTCWTGGQDDAHCGNCGALCFNCGSGYSCSPAIGACGGTCAITCSPENCQGCCVGGVCSTGTDPTSCGVGGEVCVQCSNGQSCVDGACLVLTQCGTTLCAGCCDNDVCHTGTSDSDCGTGGAACQDCAASGARCSAGSCSP